MISTFGAFLFVVLSKNEATVCLQLQYFCNYNYKLRVNATRFHLVDFIFYKVFYTASEEGVDFEVMFVQNNRFRLIRIGHKPKT